MPLNKAERQLNCCTAVKQPIICFVICNALRGIANVFYKENIVSIIFSKQIYIPNKFIYQTNSDHSSGLRAAPMENESFAIS